MGGRIAGWKEEKNEGRDKDGRKEERKERMKVGGRMGGFVDGWMEPRVLLTWTLDESPLLSEPRTEHVENGLSLPG